jgi:hypothetical protein
MRHLSLVALSALLLTFDVGVASAASITLNPGSNSSSLVVRTSDGTLAGDNRYPTEVPYNYTTAPYRGARATRPPTTSRIASSRSSSITRGPRTASLFPRAPSTSPSTRA